MAAQEITVDSTIIYFMITGIEGKRRPNLYVKGFGKIQKVPAALCKPRKSGEPPPETKSFLRSIISFDARALLRNGHWECIACGEGAKDTFYYYTYKFSPIIDLSTADLKRYVRCIIAPTCTHKGPCKQEVKRLPSQGKLDIVANNHMLMMVAPLDDIKKCGTCGKESEAKPCSHCKQVM